MNIEVRTALAALQSDPQNKEAITTLAQIHPGNGAGVDAATLTRALADARRFHLKRGDIGLCIELIDIELGWTPDGPRRADLLGDKARLMYEEMLRPGEARTLLKQALMSAPNHASAEDMLRYLDDEEAAWEKTAEDKLEAATKVEGAAAAPYFATAGELLVRYRPDSDEGENWLRKALSVRADEPRAMRLLANLLSAREAWPELCKLYEGALRSGTKKGIAELPYLVPLAAIWWKKLDKRDQAELAFRRVRKHDPAHPVALDFYRQYHTTRNEIPQYLAVLGQAQKTAEDVDVKIRLGIEIAELAEGQPKSLEKAIDTWKGLLRLQAGLPEAVAALRRLYTKTEKWNALLELLKEDVEALPETAVDEKVARYVEMLPIYRDRLKLDVMVTNTFSAILALKPDHPEALAAVGERYESQGRWADLVQVYTRQADAMSDPAKRVAIYQRVATIWIEKFNKHANAIAMLEKVLEVLPGDKATCDRLREIHTRNRAWKQLLDLNRRELPHLPVAERRASLVESARLAADKLNDARSAIALWNEAVALDQRDGEALGALAGLYEKEGRWAALCEILARLALVAGEHTAAGAAFLEKRGGLLSDKLGAADAAVAALQQVLVVLPDNARAMRTLRDILMAKGDYGALEALYAARGAYAELCDVLTSFAERTDESSARVRHYQRVAEIAAGRLHDPDRALKAYEGILAAEPGNRAAAQPLLALYRDGEKWNRLLATIEQLLDPAPAGTAPLRDDERSVLLAEARRVSEERLGSKSLAFQWCARAYQIQPADDQVAAELERLAAQADAWADLFALYAKRLAASPTPDERLRLLRRSLEIATKHTRKPDEALRLANELLDAAPGDAAAQAALEQIYSDSERWRDLAELLRKRHQQAKDPKTQAEALFRIAWLEEDKLGDRAAAARTLRALADTEKDSDRALSALARVLEASGDTKGLGETLRRQIDLGFDDENAALLLKVARIEEKDLGKPAAALDAYLQVLEVDPISADAVAGLERLLEAAAVPRAKLGAVCARLAPYYELKEDYARWARTLEALVEVVDADAERARNLELLADMYGGPLADAGKAFRAALRMLEIQPGHEANRERLVQMAQAGEPALADELLAALRRVLQNSEDASLRCDLWLCVALIEEARPGHADDAVKAYQEVFGLDPLHQGAFKALTRIFRDGERWRDLRALFEFRQGQSRDIRERVSLLNQLVEIDETLIDDRAHAIGVYQRLVQIDPLQDRHYRALARHHEAAESWSDLAEVLAELAGLVPPAEAVDVKLRRAQVLFSRLGRTAEALAVAEEIAAAVPRHEGARRLLEEGLALPAERQRVAVALEPLYEAAAEWAKLVEVLEIRRAAMPAAAGVDILARIAGIQETRLQERSVALATWKRVLEDEATSPTSSASTRALHEVERLALAFERYGELIALYDDLARKRDAADVAGRADLLGRAAKLHLTRLGDKAAAIKTWRQVLALDPANIDTARPAAAALEALCGEVGDFRGLVEVLRARVDWTSDPGERASILLRIADIVEKSLADPGAAAGTYRALLDADPDNVTALDNLERLYETLGQHRDRLDLLRRRLELAGDRTTRERLRFKMAVIAERDLGDRDEAVSSILAVLDEAADNRTALEALARLYERQNAHTQHLEILERQLQLTDGKDARIELLRKAAALLAGPLGQPRDAIDRWREILALSPGDAATMAQLQQFMAESDTALRFVAAQVLEPIYEKAADWGRLAQVMVLFIEADEDPRDRMRHRLRLAELRAAKLDDKVGALSAYAAAIRDGLAESNLATLLDACERLAAELGPDKQRDVMNLYQTVEPDVLSEDVRARMQRFVASHALSFGEVPLAAEFFRKVLDRTPDDPGVLTALEGIYRQLDDAPALFEIVSRRADLAAGDVAAELSLRSQMGALCARLGKTEEAVAAWDRVFTLRPADAEAFGALYRIYTDDARPADLASLLERRLEARPPDAVALRFQLAQIEVKDMGYRSKALGRLRAVLKDDPDHAGATAMLEEMLGDVDARLEVADLLEPIYVRGNAWLKLVSLDEIRLAETAEPARRITIIQRIARVFEEQIEDWEGAFRWYGRLFRELPADRGVRDQLLRLAGKLDRWRELTVLLGEYLDDEAGNSDDVLDIVRLAAQLADQRLNDPELARKHYRRLIEAAPGDLKVSVAFEGALERWQAFEELRDLLEEQAGQVSQQRDRVACLHRSAKLSEEKLADRDKAITTLRAILDMDAADAAASAALERLLRVEGRWADVREHLLARLERERTPAAQDGLAFRLAEVDEQHLENAEAAVDRYGEILARTPTHDGALTALERLLSDKSLRARVAELLDPHYRRAHAWKKLADIMEVLLESTDEAARRSVLLGEIADIEVRLGRPERALEARGRAWLEDVTSSDTLAMLEAEAADPKLIPRLCQLLEDGAAKADDPDLRGSLYSMVARLLETRLGAPGRAIESWRKALAARSDDEEAFVALERLLAGASRAEELAEILEKHAEIARDPGQRKMLATRIAALYEEVIKDRDKAVVAWRGVLELDDADEEALDALARLYEAGESWRDLGEVYQRRIEITKDADRLRALRLQTARLLDGQLSEAGEAVSQLRAVLDTAPADPEALALLDEIHTREAQPNELLDILDRRVAATAAATERDALALRAAKLVEIELGDVSGAVERYRQILARTPTHPQARQSLWAVARGDDDRALAVAALEPLLRTERAWGELVEILELRLAAEDAAGLRLELLAEIATIEENMRRDGSRAFDAWARAFKQEPTEAPVRDALERLTKISGDFVRLAKLYEESLPDIADSDAARALAWRLTEIHEQNLADLPRAVELLRGLADTAGPDLRVLSRLEELLRKLDQHQDREDVLAKLAEIAPDPQAQAEYLALVGDLRLTKLDDARGAVEAFRGALERVPTHPGALAALRGLLPRLEVLVDVLTVLEPLAEGRGDFIELGTLYEARLAVEDDGLERAGWLRRVAEIYETRLRDAARAVDALGRALAEDPMSTATIDDIERVARAAGLTADAAQKIELVAAGVDDSAFTELALRAARLHEETAVRSGAGDPAAERLYQVILEKDAENAAALEALEALHRRRGNIAGLISVLTRRGAQEMDPGRRLTFYGEAAGLHEKAGDLRAAIAAWQAVRDAEEGNAHALDELARLLEREGETAELVKVFDERARFAEENPDRAAFYFKAGELRAGALGDVEGAAQAFRDVLDVEPMHAGALNALARVEEERGDFAALEEVLQRRLSGAGPGERPEVLLRLARNASEKLKDADRALGYLHEVLEILPGNEDAFGRVERLLIENERWHELVEAYERRADVVAGDDLNAERAFRLKAAEVWAVRLGNTDAAAETVQKILSRDPTHVGALLVLAGLMEHEERWAEATEALDKAAASAQTGTDLAEAQFRKGRALAAQGVAEDAVQACYFAALDANTGHIDAIQALEALSRKAQNLGQLVQLLEMRERLLKDDGERRQLLIEISALYRGPLGTPAAALDAQSRLAQMAPADLQIQEDYARVLLAAGQGAQAEKILTTLVDQHTRAKRPKAVAGLQQLLGGLAESRGDGKAAAERYQAAYQLDPAHAGTLAALGRLALADKDIEKARKVYRSLLLQSFDEKAAGISKAQVYLTLGKLHVQANEVPKARNMFERGLEIEPKNAELKAALAALPK